ncbi:prolyl oligopeptidase family serine peptidase [Flavobacterium sp. MC2016-06]|jgi:dipeptidyl aminopeptidase/acylaminoacyl peptidase|uniref:S9 family peptidase n=1 Tax=Flavobacterium sp. MC2016-06 TaxID=2676308 RepID=UPI0012BAC192|nr:S9 family peptidase [Flavobacterium sp. MC2016-06]MBU3860313.1 S9 family peptidase [Flavobacterium sp. MC2016-06]
MKNNIRIFAFLGLFLNCNLYAQNKEIVSYQPSKSEILERYKKALLLDAAVKNKVFKTSIKARWQQDGKSFWYSNVLKDSLVEYILVDAVKGEKSMFFDEPKLKKALSAVVEKTLPQKSLLIDSINYDAKAKSIALKYDKSYYQVALSDYSIKKITSLPKDNTKYPSLNNQWERWNSFKTDSISPDKKWRAFIKENNVFIQPIAGGEAIEFTKDGTKEKPYGSLAWAPDSKYIVGYHITPVVDLPVHYVLSSVANTTRGQLHSQPYKQPGDPFTTYEMYLFTIENQKVVKVNTPVIDFFDAPELHWRKGDAGYFTFERVERGHQRFRILEVNAKTAETRSVVDEQTKTFIYESRLFTHYLKASNEVVMSSEKDGWRHLYLVDVLTGKEKNQITKGEWVVRSIDSIDENKREIWFSASGMNSNEDPYYIHNYRIGFDGKKLINLTPAKGNHTVAFSQNKQYYIDTYSEPNVAAIIALHRTSDGKKIMDLEKSDAAAYLATGMSLPEPFHAKGRDGVTDIWGIICRPAEFDPNKKYPVIESIYAGPQDSFVPKNFMDRYTTEMQSLAQLGFIVVQIDGMGTANRSKAFHDVCWKNLKDAGFEDRILWIKALAQKYTYVDASRVGLYGTSAGGQNALGGVLFHPEFYKAAVAACGCHDNRVDKQWWNEQWMGYPVEKHYEEQSNVVNAGKLSGDLLLIVGEADENVPPESTYRVADALIKAGKTFEFLPLPGVGHSDGGPYGRMRKRDFFVKKLLGVDPPQRNSNELNQ